MRVIKKLTCHSELSLCHYERAFLPCHPEGALRLCRPEGTEGPKDLAQDKTPRPKNLSSYVEFLRGVYPEPLEILRSRSFILSQILRSLRSLRMTKAKGSLRMTKREGLRMTYGEGLVMT